MSKQQVAVVTDSTVNFPPQIREEHDIPVIPLHVIWGEEILKDGIDIQPTAFYERLQTDKQMPTTSQPSAGEFVDFFRRVAESRGTDKIVGFFISSELSGTVASAKAAKGLLPELQIEVVDSLSTSMGLGFQVLAALEKAEKGGSVQEVIDAGSNICYDIQLMFLVDTLEFLHRGGRIGGARRLLGTALRIKPLLELENGKIETLDQVRTQKKALARMLEVAKERSRGQPAVQAAVVHANAQEECQRLKEQVESTLGIEKVYQTEVSPVIGTHTGPGTLGVSFYTG
jgi:DegV family protein with EDD domain